eukprot:TRINITY_DN4205_c0_g1_i3.p1 TRINITY_DN4205_c0_g1~~TRINITY_DN4205_c0_g1_i3.p1  ORF type:complete len:482 (-),score=149.98 TRINITY_DN4205_c0_g1_i3:490-1935(-)
MPDTADAVAQFECDPRYEVQKLLGQGSYGVVCSAVDSVTGEMVAIKKMTNVFSHPLETKRTLRELRLLRHFMQHENVLTITNVLLPRSADNSLQDIFVVTELMDTDLDQVIRSQQPLSMLHIQTFLYQILRGLQYIHASHVIHRDLKPGNILVNQNCTVKICDFGLARLEPETGFGGFMTEYVVTRWYRAPEIMLSGQDYSQSIDVWAVGCILAEMMLRRPIFPGKNYVDQVRVIVDVIGNPSEAGLRMIEDSEAREYVRTLPNKPALDFSQLGLTESLGCTPEQASQAGQLLHAMLDFDPQSRCSVKQALEHPMLAAVRAQDKDVFRPAPRFSFDFERPELSEPSHLLQLMLAEEACYQEQGGAHAHEEYLGEHAVEEAVGESMEWGRDSLTMNQALNEGLNDPGLFQDSSYNSMLEMSQRLMMGHEDQTDWGTRMLTPVCEEKSADLEKEAKESARLLAVQRASARAKERSQATKKPKV